jgi:hypothetical protein
VTVKPSKQVGRVLRRAHRSVKATLRVRLAAVGDPAKTRTRSLTLRR